MLNFIVFPVFFFSQFVEACFGPFSCSLARVGPYKRLEREGQDLLNCLHEKLDKRRRELQSGLAPTLRAKLRLSQLDLKVLFKYSSLKCYKFKFYTNLTYCTFLTFDFCSTEHLLWLTNLPVHFISFLFKLCESVL